MKWLWPEGLAGRIALVLGGTLVAAQLLSLPFFLRQQSQSAEELFQLSTVDRISHIIALLEPMTAEQRRELLPAISSPVLSLDMFFELTETDSHAADEPELAAALSRTLQRKVLIKQIADSDFRLNELLSTRQQIAIWVPLLDRSWLRFSTRSHLASMGWVAHMSAQLLLVSLILIVLAALAARQISRPIQTFVRAAERLGTDVNAPPIPERGSRELRQASRVFNTMQLRLQRYVADRTRMLAAISHDLRTSLTRLRLRAEFIEDPEQRRKAQQDLEQMDAMLASTLAFARDDVADEQQVNVDIAKLLHTVCDDLTDLGETASYVGADSKVVSCRPVALRRAIDNVLSNAISYGGDAVVHLEHIPGFCLIVVDDDGPGIAEEHIEAVFEPFVRLDPARSRSTGGSGLGLSIARSVMRSHGGDIQLVNKAAGGLTVTLSLADNL